MPPAPPDTSPENSARDELFLDAALPLFAERGFAGATMNELAVRCGSTKPTLYAHFGSKEQLFARLLRRESRRCRDFLFSRYDANVGLGLAEQVTDDVQALFDFAAEHPDGFRLLLSSDDGVAVVHAQRQLRLEVERHLALRIHDYLHPEPGDPTGASSVETLLAALVAGAALDAARSAHEQTMSSETACWVATHFIIAALTGLEVDQNELSARRAQGR